MTPPSIYIVFQRATFRSGLENQHFRILADLAANPINTVLLGHVHFWKNVPKSWKSIENEPILKFPGWDSGVLNPRTIIRLIRPLPTPKSGLKNQKSSKILNIRNPKVSTKFGHQPYVTFLCMCWRGWPKVRRISWAWDIFGWSYLAQLLLPKPGYGMP